MWVRVGALSFIASGQEGWVDEVKNELRDVGKAWNICCEREEEMTITKCKC